MGAVYFGKLLLLEPIEPRSRGSHEKVLCRCDCGREKEIMIKHLTSGHTKTCARCNMISSSEMETRKFGKLRIKTPVDTNPGSNIKVWWTCDCGRETFIGPNQVVAREHTTSCGKCHLLTAYHMTITKFGRLRMSCPTDVNPGSPKLVQWDCDCGKSVTAHVKSVVRGLRKGCGNCNGISTEGKTFGRLRALDSGSVTTGSAKMTDWMCACGNTTTAMINHVVRGHTNSCGKCHERVTTDFLKFSDEISKLKTPIRPEDIPNGVIRPRETIVRICDRVQFMCPVCGSFYMTSWYSVKRGKTLTCGCTLNRISKGQRELTEFVRTLDAAVETEKRLGNFAFDVFVPSKNLVIEYHGLYWHSMEASGKKDYEKYLAALSAGYSYMAVYEDEWKKCRSRVENLVRNRVSRSSPRSVRPSACNISSVPKADVSRFMDEFHYIGKCNFAESVGAWFDGRLVACMTFARPTRQSKHPWELTRMAADPAYRVHGIWSVLLKKFVEKTRPKSIVSFSDNRLFNGGVYEKIGFRLDGEVRPDYYWCNTVDRYHKSGFRKRPFEIGTETELRTAQGYRKIWDVGKKRWVFEL